jgi:hypothetical protein
MTRKHFLTALVLCCAPVLVEGQAPPQASPDLVKAIQARSDAIDKVDTATWERFTTSRFTVVNPDGRRLTRAERLTELKQAKPAATPSACGSERITMFAGGTAATRQCLDGGNWWLEVWTKTGQQWQVVAVQGTTAAK